MRLWSLHPRYLDRKGHPAAWREGLLAQAVLSGQTRGEAARRGCRFDAAKINDGGEIGMEIV